MLARQIPTSRHRGTAATSSRRFQPESQRRAAGPGQRGPRASANFVRLSSFRTNAIDTVFTLQGPTLIPRRFYAKSSGDFSVIQDADIQNKLEPFEMKVLKSITLAKQKERASLLLKLLLADSNPLIKSVGELIQAQGDPRVSEWSDAASSDGTLPVSADEGELPASALAGLDFGQVQLEFGLTLAAEKSLYQQLADHPNSPLVHLAVANFTTKAGEHARAKEHFAKALMLHPGFEAAGIAYANSLMDRGQPKKAIALIKALLESKPDSLDLLFSSALQHLQMNKVKEAEALIQQCLAQTPDRAEFQVLLGSIYQLKEKDKEAIQCLERANTLQPNVPFLLGSLARNFARVGEIDKALEYSKRFIELSPKTTLAYLDSVPFLLLKGQLVAAIQALKNCVKENETDSMAHAALGLFLSRMPPFFPRPTAIENTMAFPIFSEEAFTHVKRSLELLRDQAKEAATRRKPKAKNSVPTAAYMPHYLASNASNSPLQTVKKIEAILAGAFPANPIPPMLDQSNMRVYMGFYWMAKAIKQGLVPGVPSDLLTSASSRIDWLMDQIREKYSEDQQLDKKPIELTDAETAAQAKKKLAETKLGLATIALGAPPKSGEFPEATDMKVVEYLDKDRKVVHPIHKAKVQLWKAMAVPGTPNINAIYWTMIYYKLRGLTKPAEVMVAALGAVSMAKTPKKIVLDMKSIVESKSDQEVEEKLNKLGMTFEAMEMAKRGEASEKQESPFALKPESPTSLLATSETLASSGLFFLEGYSIFTGSCYLQAALVINPRLGFARVTIAKLLVVMGKLDDAKELLTDWCKSDPRAFEARYELARLSTMYKPPRTTEALEYLQEALQITPEALPVRLLLVDVLISLNQSATAIPHLLWLAEKSDTSEVRYKLGQILLAQQKVDEAETELQKAVELDDSNSMAWLALFQVLKSKQKPSSEQEKALRKVLEHKPDNLRANTELVQILLSTDRKVEARRTLAKVYGIRGEPIPAELQKLLDADKAAQPKPTPKTKSSLSKVLKGDTTSQETKVRASGNVVKTFL